MRSLLTSSVGTLIFVLFVGPGPVIGLVPWLLSRWRVSDPILGLPYERAMGLVIFLAGLPILLEALVRFVHDGRGTPAPVMPPERLVVTGLYRYVRNPMYVGVVAMIAGQGLFFGSRAILIYAACAALAFHLFVVLYEEPALASRFGASYAEYCRHVRRWLPRVHPWVANHASSPFKN